MTTQRLLIAAMALGVAGVPGVAQGQDVAGEAAVLEALRAELRAAQREIRELRDEVRATRRTDGETWMNEQRAEQVRAIVRDVLADAETRPSMSADQLIAGYNGKNFILASPDDNFLLRISGQAQVRYTYNSRENAPDLIDTDDDDFPDIGGDEDELGFTLRRMKLQLDGHVFTPKLEYELVIAANRDTDVVGAEQVRIAYELASGVWQDSDALVLAAGRFKAPFLREELTSSKRQLAVERSLVNEVFTTGFTEGISLAYQTDRFRLIGMLNDGQNAGEIGGAGDDFHNDAADFALTGRVDLRLSRADNAEKAWKQIEDFTAWQNEPFAAFAGAAVHYQVGETGDEQVAAGPVDRFLSWTVDGSVEAYPFHAFAAVMGQHADAARAAADLDHLGGLVQAGVFVIPDKLEPFARYEYIDVDGGADEVSLVTVGANYYFVKHAAKLSLDVVWALDPLTSGNLLGTSTTGLGLLRDTAGEEDQVAVRAQFQLLF